jgi:hypothetical protein
MNGPRQCFCERSACATATKLIQVMLHGSHNLWIRYVNIAEQAAFT